MGELTSEGLVDYQLDRIARLDPKLGSFVDAAHPTCYGKKKIAVTKSTTAEEIVHRLKIEREVEPVLVNNDSEGVRLVDAGKVDGFAQDDVLLYALQAGSP